METSKLVLTNPTDDELSAAVAEHVAGWTYEMFPNGPCPHVRHWKNAAGRHTSIHMDGKFATSADAVLPLLEKVEHGWALSFLPGQSSAGDYAVDVGLIGRGATFPRAACLALLRANGVEVITPQMR